MTDLDGKTQCLCFVDGLSEQVVASTLTFLCSIFHQTSVLFLLAKKKHEFSCRLLPKLRVGMNFILWHLKKNTAKVKLNLEELTSVCIFALIR